MSEDQGVPELMESDARAIREMYAQGGISYRRIALKFNVNKSLIGRIVRGEEWRTCREGRLGIGSEYQGRICAKCRVRHYRPGFTRCDACREALDQKRHRAHDPRRPNPIWPRKGTCIVCGDRLYAGKKYCSLPCYIRHRMKPTLPFNAIIQSDTCMVRKCYSYRYKDTDYCYRHRNWTEDRFNAHQP